MEFQRKQIAEDAAHDFSSLTAFEGSQTKTDSSQNKDASNFNKVETLRSEFRSFQTILYISRKTVKTTQELVELVGHSESEIRSLNFRPKTFIGKQPASDVAADSAAFNDHCVHKENSWREAFFK